MKKGYSGLDLIGPAMVAMLLGALVLALILVKLGLLV